MQEYIKNILGSGHNNKTVLIISNDEIHDIIKIVKSLEDSGLLLKGVTETFQNEVKEQKGGFLTGRGIYRAGKRKVRAGYANNSNNKMEF